MPAGQNWNNVLNYIKLNLGVPINLLEISDEDLITALKEQVLPFFSQYCPRKKWIMINESNLINLEHGQPQFRYKLPVEEGEYIVDILEAYAIKDTSVLDAFAGMLVNSQDAINLTISNTFLDALKYLNVRNTWEFLPPDILIWDQKINAAIVCYNTLHTTLDTIRPDMYQIAFKPLCLANTKLWIAAMRSKFENLATPFGPLNLNFAQLQQEGLAERENVIQILNTLPPDLLIEVG